MSNRLSRSVGQDVTTLTRITYSVVRVIVHTSVVREARLVVVKMTDSGIRSTREWSFINSPKLVLDRKVDWTIRTMQLGLEGEKRRERRE
ncbi:hypothetical protein RRG08_043056 [Elysia crispata]|uniref:Uncharacterized protein n=1 Tax=Elysia crispata TaxID=231223 RepID=A0AAE0XYU6_9GAST|nr:hypothetical protein RRG08_043056 [Elysia crispata]